MELRQTTEKYGLRAFRIVFFDILPGLKGTGILVLRQIEEFEDDSYLVEPEEEADE
jgi:hypothetical protein